MKPIYLDYNATTPVDKEVANAMRPYLEDYFGNPSSTHEYGIKTKKALMHARKQVAGLINCEPDEIIFTSGGSESNNLAIKGAAFANREKGNHIITSSIEHPAVTEVCKYLSMNGFEITYVPVDSYGMLDVNSIRDAIRPETILLTIMHANNEVGSIQPIAEIGELAKEYKILFHSDAAQSLGKIEVDVKNMGVGMLSMAGHKLYAPKGIGALYIKRGVVLEKLIHGADHEMNMRAGTENVLEIYGLGKACEIAGRDFANNYSHLISMRDLLHDKLKGELPEIKVNGHPLERLPNTLSISFPHIEANTMLSELSGVAASAGAACHTDRIDISSVLQAMKVPEEYAMGTIRFSTGKYTTKEDIGNAAKQIIEVVNKLTSGRKLEPLEFQNIKDFKLTHFTHGMGCACKIRPQYLEQALKDIPAPIDPNVLVSLSSSDDAAVYRINETTALIQTLDFFTPIVDDPYQFGAIAAANAISDIYAMGGNPVFALNIVGFPDNRLPIEVLKAILKGASDKAQEAGVNILGGHTIEDTEPKFGMAVTGFLHPENLITNSNAQPGDDLILTKPIGTGIIATGVKRGLVSREVESEAIGIMSSLNKVAAEVMINFKINACTDITGFGLLGHLKEMSIASKVDAEIYSNQIPVIQGVFELAANNIIPGGTLNNLEFVSDVVEWDMSFNQQEKLVICDAQTSGGLLISIPTERSAEFLSELRRKGLKEAGVVGRIVKRGVGKIRLQKS